MKRFQFTATHIPGSDLKITDALSQISLEDVTETDRQLQKDNDAYVTQVIEGINARNSKKVTEDTPSSGARQHLSIVNAIRREGWPHQKGNIKLCKPDANELSVQSRLPL